MKIKLNMISIFLVGVVAGFSIDLFVSGMENMVGPCAADVLDKQHCIEVMRYGSYEIFAGVVLVFIYVGLWNYYLTMLKSN